MPAFNAAIEITQSADGSSYSVEDVSNYADLSGGKSAIESRFLTIEFASGGTQDYTPTPFSYANYPDDILAISNQTVDYALRITLTLIPYSPVSGNVYTVTEVVILTANMYQFLYYLCQQLASDQSVTNIPGWFTNWVAEFGNLQMAKIAGMYSDQYSSQQAINRFNIIQNNQSVYFQ